MSDVLVPADAGWYPDPRGEHDRRFWDGADWTEHTRGQAHATPASPALAPQPLHATGFSRAVARDTGTATASLVLGIVSLVANLLAVPSIVGIVLGVAALRRQRAEPRVDHGRGRAIAGIVTSVVGLSGLLVGAILAAIAIPVFLGAQHAAVMSQIETRIQNDAVAQNVRLEPVDCPVPRSFFAGETVTCTSTTSEGRPVRITVTFTDSRGTFTWRGRTA